MGALKWHFPEPLTLLGLLARWADTKTTVTFSYQLQNFVIIFESLDIEFTNLIISVICGECHHIKKLCILNKKIVYIFFLKICTLNLQNFVQIFFFLFINYIC